MPRGGRRKGAGAPRGNLNAMTSGNYSRRLWQLNLALTLLENQLDDPFLRTAMFAAHKAGLLGSFQHIRANLPALVRLMHPILIDSGHLRSIKHKRKTAALGLPRPPRDRTRKPAPPPTSPPTPAAPDSRKNKHQSDGTPS